MKIIGIIQARMSSARLPGKIVADLCGKPMILQTVERIQRSKNINKVIIATSTSHDDDVLEKLVEQHHLNVYRGNLHDVLERFYLCAKMENTDIIVRFTGDNPLVDPRLIDEGIDFFLSHEEYDYIKYREGLPMGMAIEIFKFNALEKSYNEAVDNECREHVTPYIYRNPSKFNFLICEKQGLDYSELRWTVDTEEDYRLIQKIYECLYPSNPKFSYEDVIEKYLENTEWSNLNKFVKQNQISYNSTK